MIRSNMDGDWSKVFFSDSAAGIPHLVKEVIHVWCLPLDLPPQEQARNFSLLSPDEKARSEKFYFKKARDHFIAGRGFLRTLLGVYLNLDPTLLQFSYEQQGKPVLKEDSLGWPIQFNVSHSEGLGVLAFCLDHRVGVDIEYLRPLADFNDLARMVFTTKESTMISALSGEDKQELFYKIWTCKEAHYKALGAGLQIPMDKVGVKFKADGDGVLISSDGVEINNWQLHLFNPRTNYQCAVCVEGGNMEVVFQPSEH